LTTNELECGQPGCHLDLDIDRTRFDVFERNRGDPLNHSCPCFAHELTAQLLLRQEQLENNVAMPTAMKCLSTVPLPAAPKSAPEDGA
jgi:hypothetical protein